MTIGCNNSSKVNRMYCLILYEAALYLEYKHLVLFTFVWPQRTFKAKVSKTFVCPVQSLIMIKHEVLESVMCDVIEIC